jgi:hypothetical protein
VIQFNRLPVVLSFTASSQHRIVSLEKELAPLLEKWIKFVEVS